MLKRLERLQSQAMGRPMHLWRFGHFGAPCLVFPSASGMAHEWEAHGMVEALSDLIEGGRLKLYCAESNVAEAWTQRNHHDSGWRIRRHHDYERYVLQELVPFIREDCRSPQARIAATGCSLGALYAANFALKHPSIFHYALCLSGRYDVARLNDGWTNGDVYFNDPLAYVPHLEGEHLERIRRQTHLALVCGQGQWEAGNLEETEAFARELAAKKISHERDIWGRDVAHEWTWWRRQVRYHFQKALSQP
jgi:esterase/lipase superfamily enzyme